MTGLRRIALFVCLGMFLSLPALAERASQERTVRISGLRGQTAVAPDRTSMTATFTASAKNAAKARTMAAKQARDLKAQLQKQLGPNATIKLAAPTIHSHWGGNGQARVSQNVEIEFQGRSQVRAAKLFDLAQKAGASQISTPTGVISPAKLERSANQAVATAIRTGIRMSRSAATAAGGTAGRVQSVSASASPSWRGNTVNSWVSVEARLRNR